ncbi:16S rRNA (cytidine(1402)-2'-O)-methyltransferase [Staphylospora marina]|uniref:16S rRNA (cytidine(1402)-2'-O)-methyltransferase n=1 Tax=Staphylospora marina TaxID=2490858 RepID=UPI000F5BC9F6|nr:16S rRNA (cytidine(1402)-2'-O)-methyltransferase [Staphylospora marina]
MKLQKSTEQDRGVLYVVGTPIGNLKDMSTRAVEVLKTADLIAAEDTRHTRKLLSHFQFSTPLVSYHEHNRSKRGPEIIEALKSGKQVALVSDAGMPGISDPGEDLVRLAVEEGIPVVPVPGPNAALAALVASGLPAVPFLFLGFLPRGPKERRRELERWKRCPATLILYEAPHRLAETLQDLTEVLGDRRAAICRELTKKHEEWLRGTLSECLAAVQEGGARGEYTLVVEGAGDEEGDDASDSGETGWTQLSVKEHVDLYIGRGLSKKEAIARAAKDRDVSKRDVYNEYHRE